MKLHLGCGNVYIQDWVNVDIANEKADREEDATVLQTIDDNSCDIIYACHVLEHIGRKECIPALELWKQKLKVGGTLRLSVPDISKIVEVYDGTNLDIFLGLLYGGQIDEYDYHKVGFDEPLLRSVLRQVGFKDVKRWNWREVDHGSYDDYSQAYLPHMDKENGTLMSLNIEAVKSTL